MTLGRAYSLGSARLRAYGPLQEVDHYTTTSSGTPTRTVSYAYDDAGNLTSTGDTDLQAGPLYTATYDALSRLDVLTVKYLPGGDRTLDHDYDRYGHRSQLSVTDGAQTLVHQYSRNKLDRLTQAVFPGAGGSGTQTRRVHSERGTSPKFPR